MAGRPAKGSQRTRGDRIEASVRVRPGDTKRHYEYFVPGDDVDAWLEAATRASNAGEPIPDAKPYRRSTAVAMPPATPAAHLILASGTVPVVPVPGYAPCPYGPTAWAWFHEKYDDRQEADLERREAVRGHLVNRILPWVGEQTDMNAMDGVASQRLARHLAGLDVEPDRATPPVNTAREFTLREAALETGRSVSVLRRAYKERRFPSARLDTGSRPGGIVVVTAGDLYAAGFTMRRQPSKPVSQNYATEILWTYAQPFQYGREHLLVGHDPARHTRALPPARGAARREPATKRATAISLSRSHRVAGHLHIPFQIGLWKQRILGERVAEAFGVTFADIHPLGDDMGLIVLGAQGGRRFRYRNEHGEAISAPIKAQGKTSAAHRFVVVPPALWELLNIFVAAFFADPETGAWPKSGRLIPGLHYEGQSGINGYRQALNAAYVKEGYTYAEQAFWASTHHLRKSLGGELYFTHDIPEIVRSRLLGHKPSGAGGGSAVTTAVYSPDLPHLGPYIDAARKLERQIREEIGSLMVPTAKRPLFRLDNPMRARLGHAEEVLTHAGWLLESVDGDDHPLLDAREAAVELGISETHSRRLFSTSIRSRSVPATTGGLHRLARLDDVLAYRDRYGSRRRLSDVADELNVPYARLWQRARQGLVGAQQDDTTGEWFLDADAVDVLRAEEAGIAALHKRALSLSDAATSLHMPITTLRHHLRSGALQLDPETDTTHRQFITSASLERFAAERDAARRASSRGVDLTGFIPLPKIQDATGWTQPKALAAFRAAGVRVRRDATYVFHVQRAQLEEWAATNRPELLGVLASWGDPVQSSVASESALARNDSGAPTRRRP